MRVGEGTLRDSQWPEYGASLAEWKARGVPDDLGQQLAALPYLEPCCDIIEVARERKLKPVDVARVHFRLGDALRLPWLVRQIDQLRSEEHTSELQSLMRISYAVFCLKKKTTTKTQTNKM